MVAVAGSVLLASTPGNLSATHVAFRIPEIENR